MRKSFLSFAPPWIGQEEIDEVVNTLSSDWITTGPKTQRFEEEFGDFVGAPAALAVSSCTAALHLALATLKVGEGDGVITTPMTFCSTAHVIEHLGARPILVDVEPDTLNIDPEQACSEIRKHKAAAGPNKVTRIKALLPVHLYGHAAELDSLLQLCEEHGLALVEDAAHALPATYKGRLVGSFSESSSCPILTCFSFYATKNMTTVEGGMLVGPSEHIQEARIWSIHGISRGAYQRYSARGSWFYEVVRPGFKYNMPDFQAAIGRQQLRKLPSFQQRRHRIAGLYSQAFSELEELQVPVRRPVVGHAWHIYAVRLNLDALTLSRDQFIEELKRRNIGSSVHFIPIHVQPYYREKYGFRPEDFPVAHREYQRLISLPIFPKMTDEDVSDVVAAVSEIVRRFKR